MLSILRSDWGLAWTRSCLLSISGVLAEALLTSGGCLLWREASREQAVKALDQPTTWMPFIAETATQGSHIHATA